MLNKIVRRMCGSLVLGLLVVLVATLSPLQAVLGNNESGNIIVVGFDNGDSSSIGKDKGGILVIGRSDTEELPVSTSGGGGGIVSVSRPEEVDVDIGGDIVVIEKESEELSEVLPVIDEEDKLVKSEEVVDISEVEEEAIEIVDVVEVIEEINIQPTQDGSIEEVNTLISVEQHIPIISIIMGVIGSLIAVGVFIIWKRREQK